MFTTSHITAAPYPPASRRGGVTLMEVLISIGILMVGLLGAAAMFPVGSFFLQKGDIADRGSQVAQAAFADLVTRNELDPSGWQMWDAQGSYQSLVRLTEGVIANSSNSTLQATHENLNATVGFVYVIDPLGIAAGTAEGLNQAALSRIPFAATQPPPRISGWGVFTDSDDTNWPVRRLTSNASSLGQVPSLPLAMRRYMSGDDVAFSLDDTDLPTSQLLTGRDTNGNGKLNETWGRETRGDYSWMVTVAPTQSAGRHALATDPSAYYYDVSVVVFYKRPYRNLSENEHLLAGEIVSTGTGGGEILLDASALPETTKPYEQLRLGQWVMVSGVHPASARDKPLFYTQWYRVVSIAEEAHGKITDPEKERLVGLRGPDWPWYDRGTRIRVGLFPGAVAVHTKSIRLDGPGAYGAD